MIDIALEDYEGDIALVAKTIDGVTGYDFDLTADDTASIKQVLYSRLNTQNPDWYIHMLMGASLEVMIGQPNTRENGMRIANKIKNSINYLDTITNTRILDVTDYDVRVIPVTETTVLAVVTIGDVQMYVDFSYTNGIQEVGIL